MNKISKIIVEQFEKDYPALMGAIMQAVTQGEKRANFERIVKSQFPDHKTSIMAQASMTAFDYYNELKKQGDNVKLQPVKITFETMELTTEDRQRIEQEVDGIYKNNKDQYTVRKMMHQIAEYATIFERQQQTELRNKVIEECIEQLKDTRDGDMIVRFLNSLKTKS